jgi:CheY-like chemotaxis protein
VNTHPPKNPGRVLIVDDEQPVRALLVRWLTKWGCHVADAASASQALALMATQPVDVLLCDIGMPDRDGLWLAEQVRTRWPQTAIVMSTGRDDPETVRASKKVGAVAYVLKPFDPVLLRSAIDDTMRA